MKAYVRVSAAVFTVVAVLQLLRVVRGWPLDVAGMSIPVSASIVAAIGAGALAAWGWASARGASR